MKNILIVEDEIIIGLDIASKLQSNGFKVTGTVTSPDAALKSIDDKKPDLILMDINLNSSIDGIELAEKIYESYNIPVVYLTSYSDQKMIDRSMKTEPYGYLIKPYTDATLLATLKISFTRIKLEKKLLNQTKVMTNVMNNINDGIVEIDSDGTILLANNQFCKMMNINEAVGENISKVGGSIFDIIKLKALYENENSDIFNISQNNIEKFIYVSVSSLSSKNDGRMLFTLTDLTEIYTMKDAIYIAEGMFTELFRKKLIAGVLVSFPDGNIFEYNKAFVNMYKINKDFEKANITDFFGKDFLNDIKDQLKSNESFKLDNYTQTKQDKTVFTSNIHGQMVTLDNCKYFLIDVYDVSEKLKTKEKEKELQQKLIHANKMTSLGTLVSGVAHEINNPNNFIMFNSSLLLDFLQDTFEYIDKNKSDDDKIGNIDINEFKEDFHKLITGISNGADRIKTIVQDLKGFAKQDDTSTFEKIDLTKVIKTAVRILNHQIFKATNNFELNIEENLPAIMGNAQKIEQVLINLLMNSIEALQDKNDSIHVKCYCKSDKIFVEIVDTGTGISEENLHRITDPFFTTKQQDGGTGLGLSIAYSIINEHKGKLNFSSTLNQGTNILIELPKAD
jgi:signal transduction histidine kinase/CheY-like chemotaxis protein